MKTIGLIGGMSCESSAEYYRLINNSVRQKLGGLNSAKIILNSLNFQEIADLQKIGDWNKLQECINQAGLNLQKAGADCVLICTNLMHKCAQELQEALSLPLIHIADACGELMQEQGVNQILLLGTIYTMEEDFYSQRLETKYGIKTIIPDKDDRKIISDIIYQELCQGIINPNSKNEYLRIINKSQDRGAQAALLACTEIPLLVQNGEAEIPLYETTAIHANKAVEFALANLPGS